VVVLPVLRPLRAVRLLRLFNLSRAAVVLVNALTRVPGSSKCWPRPWPGKTNQAEWLYPGGVAWLQDQLCGPAGPPQLTGGAVRLMYAGAALSAVVLIVTLVTIASLDLIISFTQVHVLTPLIVSVIVWLAGLGAIILLFSKESGPYFAKSASPPG
jgi:hypothetical protein